VQTTRTLYLELSIGKEGKVLGDFGPPTDFDFLSTEPPSTSASKASSSKSFSFSESSSASVGTLHRRSTLFGNGIDLISGISLGSG
jgi:hypothetical protein